jgi:hypothetical protein
MEKRLFLVGGVAAEGTGVSTATAALGANRLARGRGRCSRRVCGGLCNRGRRDRCGGCLLSPRCWDGRGGEPPQEIGVVHPSDDAGLGADVGVAAGETDARHRLMQMQGAPGCRTSPWAANASPVLPPRRRRRRQRPAAPGFGAARRRTTRPRSEQPPTATAITAIRTTRACAMSAT